MSKLNKLPKELIATVLISSIVVKIQDKLNEELSRIEKPENSWRNNSAERPAKDLPNS